MVRQIQIGTYATIEIRPADQWTAESKVTITDDRGREAALTLKSARELYAALRTLDSEGLLSK